MLIQNIPERTKRPNIASKVGKNVASRNIPGGGGGGMDQMFIDPNLGFTLGTAEDF